MNLSSALDTYGKRKYDLAVVVGPRSNRKKQETSLFQNLRYFNTFEIIANTDSLRFCDLNKDFVSVRKLIPDVISDFFIRRPYSPVSLIELEGIDEALANADIINCIELYSPISLQCSKIAESRGKKVALSVFETLTSVPHHWIPPLSRNIRSVIRRTNLFIAYTNRSKEYLRQLSIPREKIEVIYPGTDLQKFYPPKNCNHSNLRILFVGGFAGEKGIGILIKAFSKLYRKNSQTELWICAKPRTDKEEAVIKSYSRKYPVKAFGYVDYNKMPEIYRQCDIFCLPSFDKSKFGVTMWEEQFGFALVEAMASGLPIVASDCGAIPEVIGSHNAVVPQRSVNSLYEALCEFIENENHRLRVGKLNRNRAKELFDIRKQRAKVDEILYELL
jgi:glycosyltransferase involved in cell wall biosynthesis